MSSRSIVYIGIYTLIYLHTILGEGIVSRDGLPRGVLKVRSSSEIKSATTCYWDKEKDRQVQLRWENKFMNVFVHLYALKTEY